MAALGEDLQEEQKKKPALQERLITPKATLAALDSCLAAAWRRRYFIIISCRWRTSNDGSNGGTFGK